MCLIFIEDDKCLGKFNLSMDGISAHSERLGDLERLL